MLLGGLFVPLLAALGPILRGASMSVRDAIASYGLGGDFGSNRFDLWVERIGALFLPTLYAAALGNLFRRKGRLLLTQSVLIYCRNHVYGIDEPDCVGQFDAG